MELQALRGVLSHVSIALGAALWAGSALALSVDYTRSLDLADATARTVIVWIEQSDAVAPGDTPDLLDSDWSAQLFATYTSDGTTATVTVDGVDVPEPETFALVGSGLLGLAMFSQRRRRTR